MSCGRSTTHRGELPGDQEQNEGRLHPSPSSESVPERGTLGDSPNAHVGPHHPQRGRKVMGGEFCSRPLPTCGLQLHMQHTLGSRDSWLLSWVRSLAVKLLCDVGSAPNAPRGLGRSMRSDADSRRAARDCREEDLRRLRTGLSSVGVVGDKASGVESTEELSELCEVFLPELDFEFLFDLSHGGPDRLLRIGASQEPQEGGDLHHRSHQGPTEPQPGSKTPTAGLPVRRSISVPFGSPVAGPEGGPSRPCHVD